MDELGLFASILGHIGDGNFHESIMYQPHEKAAVEHVVHRMVNRALEMEGTVTGEHGVGRPCCTSYSLSSNVHADWSRKEAGARQRARPRNHSSHADNQEVLGSILVVEPWQDLRLWRRHFDKRHI